MTTFANSQEEFRDLWGSYHLFIGGKDVTNFRGRRALIGSYQLTEPYSYGPADFVLPSLTQFEVDQWGTGALKWMGNGKSAVLKQVLSGDVVREVWRGFITIPEVTATGVVIHCDGEASGRLSLRTKLPDLYASKQFVGRKIWDSMVACRVPLTPYLGGSIGVKTDGRGMSGTYLDHVNALLAATVDTDGSQYTIRHSSAGGYHLGLKDTDTVDFTIHVGSHGVDIDLSSDLSEQPNTIYGQGVAPNGLVWVNAKYPGLIQGDAPPYPMDDHSSFSAGTTDGDTDTGDGITVMIWRLIAEGYLDHRKAPGGYDSDVTEALKDLQDDAGITVSGNVNTATWSALWNVDVTGFTLRTSRVAPLAQTSTVRRWNRGSNGTALSKNPFFDPKVVQVDLAVDHGTSVEKSRARRWSKGVLNRAQNEKNWAGTITLTSDVFAGSHFHSDPTPTPMSRLDIRAGDNVMVRHFDGDTLMHVSIVNVNGDQSVTLGVDCRARDAATLGEVIARNIESRVNPARQWLQSRRTDANARVVEFSEVGGQIFNTIVCPADEWTVFPVLAGQAGSVARVRLHTSNNEAAFALAITARKTSPGSWQHAVGNPLRGTTVADVSLHHGGSGYTSAPTVTLSGGGGSGATATATLSGDKVISLELTDGGSGYGAPPTVSFSGGGGSGAAGSAFLDQFDEIWTTPKLTKLVDDDRALLGAWGTADQPCGYWPRAYTGPGGQATGAPITGLFIDDGGFDYHTFTDPVLWVAIYPDRDTKILPQRMLWETLEVIT